MGSDVPTPKEFEVNQRVRVKRENPGPNRRVPGYARGMTGVIVKAHGVVPGHGHDHADDWGLLYSVLLDDPSGHSGMERIILDLHISWLE